MSRAVSTLILVGILIVAGATIAGYYLGFLTEEKPQQSQQEETPSFSPTPASSPQPAASASPQTSDALPTAPPAPPSPLIKGITDQVNRLLSPSPIPRVSSAASAAPTQPELAVELTKVPPQIKKGSSFTVEWTVTGHPADRITTTTIKTGYTDCANKNASINKGNQTATTTGSFIPPQTFRANVAVGSRIEKLEIEVLAVANGSEVRSAKTFPVN